MIALRATTHLDWVPLWLAGNRYGELLIVYYTLVWFDRYLKGADDPAMGEAGRAASVLLLRFAMFHHRSIRGLASRIR